MHQTCPVRTCDGPSAWSSGVAVAVPVAEVLPLGFGQHHPLSAGTDRALELAADVAAVRLGLVLLERADRALA